MKILLINGGVPFGGEGGELSKSLHEIAVSTLSALGHEIKQTHIKDGYDIAEEVAKWAWMDAVIWQMPAWWMGEPWQVKKYVDEVFMGGFGVLVTGDGRHRDTPNFGYGTGGLLGGKRHMLSVTWNAPLAAFEDEGEFFGGVGADGVYLHFHKANEFLGTKPLPTFMCNDVIKNPDFSKFFTDYEAHLKRVFG